MRHRREFASRTYKPIILDATIYYTHMPFPVSFINGYRRIIYLNPQDFWGFWRMRRQCVPGSLPRTKRSLGSRLVVHEMHSTPIIWSCNYFVCSFIIALPYSRLHLRSKIAYSVGVHGSVRTRANRVHVMRMRIIVFELTSSRDIQNSTCISTGHVSGTKQEEGLFYWSSMASRLSEARYGIDISGSRQEFEYSD